MTNKINYKQIVSDFEAHLMHFAPYYEQLHQHGGKVDIDFFVPDHCPTFDRAMNYDRFKDYKKYFNENNKFKDLYFVEALQLLRDETERYIGQDAVEWIFKYLDDKLGNKTLLKVWDNHLYGTLVDELVKFGASRLNSIEFVSRFTGVSKTTIRDSSYAIRKAPHKLSSSSALIKHRLHYHLTQHSKNILKILDESKFAKTKVAYLKIYELYDRYEKSVAADMKKAVAEIEKEFGIKLPRQNTSA